MEIEPRPGLVLRRWRLAQTPRVSQAALGARIGVSRDLIRHFENGHLDLTLQRKVDVCEETGLPLYQLATKSQLDFIATLFRLQRNAA